MPGLIAGYVDRIDVAPLHNISLNDWVTVCRGAYELALR